jgi:hypothetical protein
MGVIIKYQLVFPEVGLKVSNDMFSGEFILDADITAEMKRGMSGASFEIKLVDLPLKKANQIKAKIPDLATVIIKLGYVEGPFENVMHGIIEKVTVEVQDDKLITTIKGLETGAYALLKNCPPVALEDNMTVKAAVERILAKENILKGEISSTPQGLSTIREPDPPIRSRAYDGEKLMKILDNLAEMLQAEFFVADKTVWIDKPITNESYEPPKFDPKINLAAFSPIERELEEECDHQVMTPLPATRAEAFSFITTGDPKLRPGQKVSAAVEGFASNEFRIHEVTHKLSASAGYTCQGRAIKARSDDNCRRRERALVQPGARDVAEGLTRGVETQQRNRPTIETGKVKTYSPGGATGTGRHLSALYFGQRFERTETQPSIHAGVENDEEKVFHDKPHVSPFAWRKCGLVTPVYPGMKALLAHNRNLKDDAMVVGFLWSEQPAFEPPQNHVGDWWLCLPIDFDTNNPPADSDKAVNDLTANNGKRVIEVKGLKITVGADKLSNVGARPSEGADDEFLIEHKSGAKFKIAADGAITIEATSISIKGDVTIEGNVDVK